MFIQIATIFGYEVTLPTRGSEEAAGIDIYVPMYNEVIEKDFLEMNTHPRAAQILTGSHVPPYIRVSAHNRVLIPTGLRMKVEPGTYLEVANRGSVAAKQGLVFGAHIVDSDYRGNVFINLINTGTGPQTVNFGQKIAQIIHKQCLMSDVELVSDTEFNRTQTSRGSGALGSTGR